MLFDGVNVIGLCTSRLNRITLRRSRFPDLFSTSTDLSLSARRTFVTFISIYICWHLYLHDIFKQENLYILPLLYVVIGDQKTVSEKNSFSLSLRWLLNNILQVFTIIPYTCNEGQKNSFVKSIISTKNRNQTSRRKPDLIFQNTNLKKINWFM